MLLDASHLTHSTPVTSGVGATPSNTSHDINFMAMRNSLSNYRLQTVITNSKTARNPDVSNVVTHCRRKDFSQPVTRIATITAYRDMASCTNVREETALTDKLRAGGTYQMTATVRSRNRRVFPYAFQKQKRLKYSAI